MLLSDLYKRLALGELRNHPCTDGNIIAEDQRESVGLWIDDALLQLYTDFVLRYGTSELVLIADQDRYNLDDNLIRLIEVRDSACKKLLPLNDRAKRNSLFTPSSNILEVPEQAGLSSLILLGQMRHDIIQNQNGSQPIVLPRSLEQALTSYVAYRAYGSMGGDDHMNRAGTYKSLYEEQVQKVKDEDLASSTQTQTNTKFELNGWV